ncbi:MAG: hypothetical protein LBL45_09845 [Treponema sp.]|jgi:hypothetical protein|nr:hypothetical protein [Treponema sp.]
MIIKYNVTGAERKALAVAVAEILGQSLRYCGMPTANYEAGGYTITRTGELIGPGSVNRADNSDLLGQLIFRGYGGTLIDRGEDEPQPSDIPGPGADNGNNLTIDMPLDGFTPEKLGNLTKLVNAKASIIKKALAADDLPIKLTEDKLRFPWFTLTGEDGEPDAYIRFTTALCEMAKRQKRVTAKEREITNDKFTMRVFLVRLGFIGPEYKTARKILLRYLTGNSAWKNGPPERNTNNSAVMLEETEERYGK